MWLAIAHPELPTCDICQTYIPQPEKGWALMVREAPDMEPELRRRPIGAATPCGVCPKIPQRLKPRTRQNAQELSERNRKVFDHYRECKAVGRFPNDPWVRAHAAIIREVEDEVERGRQERLFQVLSTALGVIGGR